ncbi:MAG: hypothetical protein RL414_1107, partial [Actinomycetota bacterium]
MASRITLVRRALSEPVYTSDGLQESVIAHRNQPAVVWGKAGTGKTTTLIRSVLSRIDGGTDPSKILIITYGRESASRLRDAIAVQADSTAAEPLARTFHSLAFSILNEKLTPDDPSYVLVSGAEQDAYIKDLLDSGFDQSPWHTDLTEARNTRGFIREVRDLILRATEMNLTPKSLLQFAAEMQEPYWEGAAHFWSSYHQSMELRSATVADGIVRIDPSAIIVEAIARLKDDPVLLRKYRSAFSTIVVDEFQESDPSHRELLRLIAGDDLIVFFDPSSAVGRFRGADPDGAKEFLSDFKKFELTTPFRSIELPRTATEKSADYQVKRNIELAKLASNSDVAHYIAHAFRTAHLHDGVPWSEMAVVVRSPGIQVSTLQRAFALNGIPLNVDAQALALADNPAVRPLLDIAQLALQPSLISVENWAKIEPLLLSEFAGGDSLELRQIRLALAKERAEDDQRTTTQMMIELLTSPLVDTEVDIRPILRIRDLIAAAKKANRGRNISDVLWAIWSNAVNYEGVKIADAWRARALKGGAKGGQADRDLDAVIQLFEAARRFTERSKDAQPILFIDQMLGERILGDAITSKAQREEVVSLLTVHSSKGQEWGFVAIAGLQEGQWPNLKERGSLLGSERLVEAVHTSLRAPGEIAASAAFELLKDEKRLLNVAITRAKSRVIVAAVEAEDSHPSRFFDDLREEVLGEDVDLEVTTPERSLTSHALVSELRRTLMKDEEKSGEPSKEFAATLLHTLAQTGVQSADPENWLGVRELSTEKPIVAEGEPVYVSPSSLQAFTDCGLKWFLERSGAKDGDSVAQLLGIAVHALAALVKKEPDISAAVAVERLTQSWKIVDQNIGWYKDAQLEKASKMLER